MLGALAVALVTASGLWARPAAGELARAGEAVIAVSGEAAPGKLPRLRRVPIRLRLGFTSEAPSTPMTPELSGITLEVSRDLAFQTAGLPSCPITKLYSEYSDAGPICPGSLVGSGIVISEVTLPGHPPVTIEGHLSAFYDFGDGEPRILAQVRSTGSLPLTYVIPFTISKAHGVFGTILSVEQMRFIAGECARGHANCFSQTYTYQGIYGHISKFEFTLDRQFVDAGKRTSVLSADCPAPGNASSVVLPLVKATLTYAEVRSLSQVATRRCEVVRAPRHDRRPG
jgi:hypothetical protein